MIANGTLSRLVNDIYLLGMTPLDQQAKVIVGDDQKTPYQTNCTSSLFLRTKSLLHTTLNLFKIQLPIQFPSTRSSLRLLIKIIILDSSG